MVLIIGHGSRNKTGNEQILEFTNQLRKRQPQWEIEVCYIELADYLIDEGLKDAAKKAERVVVIPLILNAAGHVKEELPKPYFCNCESSKYGSEKKSIKIPRHIRCCRR